MKRLESSIGEQSGSVFASILTGFLLCAHRLSTPSRMLSFLERVLIPKCTPFLNIQLSFHSPPQARTNIGGGLQGRGASDTPHARGKKRVREREWRTLSFFRRACWLCMVMVWEVCFRGEGIRAQSGAACDVPQPRKGSFRPVRREP